jgi:hypothetical protein
MFASVFTPGQKIFLHIVAAMALAAAAWRIWTMVNHSDNQLYYLPVIALWFIYYGVCLRTVEQPRHYWEIGKPLRKT